MRISAWSSDVCLSDLPLGRVSASTFLLPMLLASMGFLVSLFTRRARVQRELLEKQSVHLKRLVDRARRQEDVVTEVLDAVDFGVTRITPAGELVLTNEAHARLRSEEHTSELQS